MKRFSVVRLIVGMMSVIPITGQAQQTVAVDRDPSAAMRAEALFARPVTVQLDRVSVKQAVNALAASANVQIQYRADILDAVTAPVTLHAAKMPLGVALDRVLSGTPLRAVATAMDRVTIKPAAREERSVQGIIMGRVADARTQQPLRGASVLLDDAAHGISTNDDGTFRLTGVSAGSHRVTVRILGYVRQTQTVVVRDGEQQVLNVALEASANTLDQVVVTGTIIPTALKAVPNAITVITAKQIDERGITRIDQLFRGDVPGLFSSDQGSGTLLDEVVMYSRGVTALSSVSSGTTTANDGAFMFTNPIKTYVDGVEMADPKYLSQIDPKSVERIEILTGPQASTIYGSKAMNGVMQVFTKRGTSNAPQLTLNLQSGWVQNNFSTARTPQHDYSAQLNGIEGRMSYNAGGSWNYMGPWTPSKQEMRTSAFGGTRLRLPTPLGAITADITLRRAITRNRQRGGVSQTNTAYQETGWWTPAATAGVSTPSTAVLRGQTLGMMLAYTPTGWWSHELGVGQDVAEVETRYTGRGYTTVSDTTLLLSQTRTDRRSMRYTTTLQVPVTPVVRATFTTGADAWQDLNTVLSVQPQTLTGTLAGSTTITRQPGHNTGGFVQAQLAIQDQLFVTYGLRAEWNPGFGADAQPNYAPRYGVAYTRELGPLTTKVRASYGRATRPPQQKLKATVFNIADRCPACAPIFTPFYGNFVSTLANPELAPEHQQGGEGGLELYWGARGSLVVTRYNQIIDGLIDGPVVDSVRTLAVCPSSCPATSRDVGGYGYYPQMQWLNIGAIRNQGWELQGSTNTGPLTTHATYSWTKSRTIGVNSKYRAYFTPSSYPQYQLGATFQYLPEHTWAVGMTYARAATTVGLNLTGTGRIMNRGDDFAFRNLFSNIRLSQNRLHMNLAGGQYTNVNNGYTLADLTASHSMSSRVDGIIQIQNLMNRYTNDYYAGYATIGRQSKFGLRIRT